MIHTLEMTKYMENIWCAVGTDFGMARQQKKQIVQATLPVGEWRLPLPLLPPHVVE